MIKQTLCFSNKAFLSLALGQLVIELPEQGDSPKRKITRPIEDIGVVVIESPQVTFTSALITALLENNVAVITCDTKHMPHGLLLPLEGNSIQSERFRNQINASIPLKKQLWQQTVSQKIYNQYRVLSKYSRKTCKCMEIWSKDVRSGDPDNLEGRAAAFYWRNLFPEDENFKRDRDEDGINTLLNYGYAILRAVIARALVGSGLLPTLGIHHHNRYNAYCLADDIMEPYRPYVDQCVIQIAKRYDDIDELTPTIKKELLQIPVIDVKIGTVTRPLMIAATMTSASLAKCFDGESRKIQYPKL